MQHTRRHRVPEHARSVGEHAGVRRAPCDEDACAKLGGAAGWRRSQRGRALYSELWGKWRRLGRARRRKQQRRRGRGRPREAHAAAHPIRIVIVPVDAPSKADQPPELRLVAGPCGLPQMSVAALLGSGLLGSGLLGSGSGSGSGSGGLLGLGGTEPAHVLRGVSGARGSADEFPDTQSEQKSGSRGPKGAKHDKLHKGASTGTGRAPELAARASAHAR